MSVTVQLPGYNRNVIGENLANIVNAGTQAYHNYKAAGLADEETKKAQIQNQAMQQQTDQANAFKKAADTPGTPESNTIKTQHSMLLSALTSSGAIKDPVGKSALSDWSKQIQDPNVSGWKLDQMTQNNSAMKEVGDLVKAKMSAEAMGLRYSESGPLMQQRNERIHNDNLKAINKDPTLTKLNQSADNLNNAITNFQKGGATPQEFGELQQAVRANAGIKGSGGVGERQETYLKSLGIDRAKFIQFISGDPQSVLQADPAFANQMVQLANLELQNKRGQVARQLDQLAAGHNSFYSRPGNEKLAEDFTNTVGLAKNRILNPEMQPPAGQAGGQAPGAPAAPAVDPTKMTREQKIKLLQGG